MVNGLMISVCLKRLGTISMHNIDIAALMLHTFGKRAEEHHGVYAIVFIKVLVYGT